MEPSLYLASTQTADKRRRVFGVSDAPAPGEGTTVGELHLFVGREWFADDGSKIDLSGDVFDQMIRNFRARESKTLSVDFDHRSWHPTHPSSEAAGWVTDLFTRTGASGFRELWAKVEWVAEVADKIRAGKFKFCSPTFITAEARSTKTGNDIGAELLNVALTNIPFQDGLQPIKLSLAAAGGNRTETMAMPTEDKPADDKPAADKPADDNDAVNKMSALLDRFAETVGLDRLATLTLMNEKADEIGRMLGQAADKDGTPAEDKMSKEDALLLTTQVGALQAQLGKLVDEVASLSKSAADRDAADAKAREMAIAAEADAIIADGRAFAEQRDGVIHMLTHKPELAATTFGRKVTPIGVRQAGPEHRNPPAPSTDKIDGLDVSDLAAHERELVRGFIGMGMKPDKAKQHLMKNRDELAKRAARVGLA